MFKPFLIRATSNKKFLYVFIAGIFLAFHYYLIVYINSTLLGQFISRETLGTIYISGSILHILLLLQTPKFAKKFGVYHLMLSFTLLEILFLTVLALSTTPSILIGTFILHHAISPLLLLCLNICLEDQTESKHMGETRGLFLTILSIAAVTAPIFSGTLFESTNGLRPVYLVSALFMFLFFFTILTNFKQTRYGEYKKIDTLGSIKELLSNKELTLISIAGIILQFLFSWLIIYLPIYLDNEIGIPFKDIGILISITLLPFLFLEIPVGELADQTYGEKEFLIGGMLISAVAFFAFQFITSSSIVTWGLIVLLARTGASIMETAIETYFYKKAKGRDELISVFSLGSPIAYIIGPLIGSLTLVFFPFKSMFTILAVVLVCGSLIMIRLKDTK